MDNLRRLQLCELAMLKEAVRICDKYGLTYYLSAGTFLGAVRHKGFIPWDDDVDIRMPRGDYEKFVRVLRKELKEPYKGVFFRYGNATHRYYCRIEDPRIKLKRSQGIKEETSSAWMDIFPLDGMPKDPVKNKLRQLRLLWRRMWFQISVFDETISLKKKRPLHERIIIWLVLRLNLQKRVSFDRNWVKLDRALKSCSAETAYYYVNFMGYYKFRDMIPKSVYGEGAMYPFEDAEFKGPADYDAFLTALYGDYMQLPPEEDRNKHSMELESMVIEGGE